MSSIYPNPWEWDRRFWDCHQYKLGFDYNWYTVFMDKSVALSLQYPPFERKIIDNLPDEKIKVINAYGVIELEKPGSRSIPTEVNHLLNGGKG